MNLETQQMLTPRERELLVLLRMGRTNNEMAQSLDLSVNTIKTHLKNLYRKLEVRNRTEAAAVRQEQR